MNILPLLLAATTFLGASPLPIDDDADAKKAEQAIIESQVASYPLDTCIITGKALDSMGGPLDIVREDRLIRLCCKGCIKAVDKDLKGVIAKIDAAVVKAQLASYPLETCPVTDAKLGSMGDPIDYVYGTRLVRFCCKGCIKPFEKEPAKYLQEVDAALIAAQTEGYPLDTCVVTGKALDSMGGPLDYLHGTRLVRFCCKGCIKPFRKEPAKYLAMIDAAKKG